MLDLNVQGSEKLDLTNYNVKELLEKIKENLKLIGLKEENSPQELSRAMELLPTLVNALENRIFHNPKELSDSLIKDECVAIGGFLEATRIRLPKEKKLLANIQALINHIIEKCSATTIVPSIHAATQVLKRDDDTKGREEVEGKSADKDRKKFEEEDVKDAEEDLKERLEKKREAEKGRKKAEEAKEEAEKTAQTPANPGKGAVSSANNTTTITSYKLGNAEERKKVGEGKANFDDLLESIEANLKNLKDAVVAPKEIEGKIVQTQQLIKALKTAEKVSVQEQKKITKLEHKLKENKLQIEPLEKSIKSKASQTQGQENSAKKSSMVTKNSKESSKEEEKKDNEDKHHSNEESENVEQARRKLNAIKSELENLKNRYKKIIPQLRSSLPEC
jgi:DNA repair exonuclease SbcCD ATPase subunit